MATRPIPKALKQRTGKTSFRRVLLADGPCTSPQAFDVAHAGPSMRVPIPGTFDCATYVADREVDGVWHYRLEQAK